jgi:hypothetical protein
MKENILFSNKNKINLLNLVYPGVAYCKVR